MKIYPKLQDFVPRAYSKKIGPTQNFGGQFCIHYSLPFRKYSVTEGNLPCECIRTLVGV